MAVTITRTSWVDDDGTGTTGTVINNAVKTSLYNEIDTALAKVAQLAGGNTFTGNQVITGGVAITGNGSFTGQLTVGAFLGVRNLLAGATQRTDFQLGNDANAALLDIVSYASNFTATVGFDQPNSSLFYQGGAGGLSFVAGVSPGPIRFFTGSSERMRIAPNGVLFLNTITNAAGAIFAVAYDDSQTHGLGIQCASPTGTSISFANSSGTSAGSITQTALAVSYNTSSDARLKDDDGRATDLSALRAVVVHDFRWKADGIRDRGVFAQEAHDLFPRAVCQGTDDTTDDGTLKHPWMTDYSKFVPDLIVGWQQHDAELTELRALLAAVKG